MKIFTTKYYLAIVCTFVLGASTLVSCSGNSGEVDGKEVAELQKQLDSTMQLYQQVKSENSDLDSQMSSRDSTINAQAAEIQHLIDKLHSQKSANVAPVSNADNKQIEKQKKEIREKENAIKQLEKQINQQSKQIDELKKSSKSADCSQYQSQISSLQNTIDKQEKQIAKLKDEANDLKLKSANQKTANCDQIKKDYESQIASLNSEAKDYRSQISDLNRQINSLKADISALGDKKTDAGNDAELQSLLNQLAKANASLDECQQLSKKYQSDLKKATDEYKLAESNLAKCQADLDVQVATVKSLQNSNAQGGKTEQQLRSELAEMTQKEASARAYAEKLDKSMAALNEQCEKDQQSLQSNVNKLQSQVSDLQSRVDRLSAENGELADLRSQLEGQKTQIDKLQSELQQCNDNLAKAQEAAKSATPQGNRQSATQAIEQRLAELQALCDGYVAEIERLRAENEQLKNENAELKDKVASSSTLFAENERLQQKVKLASVLVSTDLKVTPGKELKPGNVVKPATKAAQIKVVRIDGRLLDNNVIDPGSITIYARIATANNRVVCNGSADDYSFDMNGVQMQYTVKQDIEFTGYGRNITMIWKKGENVELAPGLYWVTLYANGYEIGKVSFKLD